MNFLDIDAFFPYYNEEKNSRTCVLYKNGIKEFVRPNISKYVLQLYFAAGLNKEAVHAWSSKVLKATFNLPLLLTDKLIFIPIKFQPQPYTPGHSFTFGYINYDAIAFYSEREVMLKNQLVLQTISPTQFIDKKIRDAILLGCAYREKKNELGF